LRPLLLLLMLVSSSRANTPGSDVCKPLEEEEEEEEEGGVKLPLPLPLPLFGAFTCAFASACVRWASFAARRLLRRSAYGCAVYQKQVSEVCGSISVWFSE
jgi:hypothetical protein